MTSLKFYFILEKYDLIGFSLMELNLEMIKKEKVKRNAELEKYQ
jgi:hypothetical protein